MLSWNHGSVWLHCIFRCQRYETHLGLQVKCPIFLSDFIRIRNFSIDFRKSPHCHENLSSGSRAGVCRYTCMTKLADALAKRLTRTRLKIQSQVDGCRESKSTSVFIESAQYCWPILTEFGALWHISVRVPNIKFDENRSCGRRADTCRQTSRSWSSPVLLYASARKKENNNY